MKTNKEFTRSKDMDTFERHLSLFLFFHWIFSPFFMGRNWIPTRFKRKVLIYQVLMLAHQPHQSSHSFRPNPFRLIPKTLDPRVTDERKKIPTWNLLGVWVLGFDFPPRWLGLQIEGWKISKPQHGGCTNPGGDKKIHGGDYITQKG